LSNFFRLLFEQRRQKQLFDESLPADLINKHPYGLEGVLHDGYIFD
jgi:hypothetical protein